jgi:hypothetical protein
MMPDVVQVRHMTGQDRYGSDTYGSVISIPARVVYRGKQTFNDAGEIVQARAIVFLFGDNGIKTSDQVTLPDGEIHPVASVNRYPDEDGMYYEQLFVL